MIVYFNYLFESIVSWIIIYFWFLIKRWGLRAPMSGIKRCPQSARKHPRIHTTFWKGSAYVTWFLAHPHLSFLNLGSSLVIFATVGNCVQTKLAPEFEWDQLIFLSLNIWILKSFWYMELGQLGSGTSELNS